MLKKLLIFLFILFWFGFFVQTYAEDQWIIYIEVNEEVPWASCSKMVKEWGAYRPATAQDEKDNKAKIVCKIKRSFAWVVDMIWSVIEYFTFLAWIWAVLFIVINWIMYSTSWLSWEKEKAKERIISTLIWIVLLLLSWVILNILAPWVYK